MTLWTREMKVVETFVGGSGVNTNYAVLTTGETMALRDEII